MCVLNFAMTEENLARGVIQFSRADVYSAANYSISRVRAQVIFAQNVTLNDVRVSLAYTIYKYYRHRTPNARVFVYIYVSLLGGI